MSARSEADTERRRRRTSLTFDDRAYDISTGELRQLVQAVGASITDDFLRTPATPTRLHALADRSGGGGRGAADGGSRWSPQRHRGSQPTEEQAAAIGLLGEFLAFRWLERTYPQHVTPDSWVSGNRSILLDGHSGNDRLGFDFHISRRSGPLLFEVKATMGDEYVFDITDRELAVATAARRGSTENLHPVDLVAAGAAVDSAPQPVGGRLLGDNRALGLRFSPS